jgi:hypothetical protein
MTTEPQPEIPEQGAAETEQRPTSFLTRKRLIWLSVSLFVLWLILGWIPYFMTRNNGDPQARAGQYGDMFGLVVRFLAA